MEAEKSKELAVTAKIRKPLSFKAKLKLRYIACQAERSKRVKKYAKIVHQYYGISFWCKIAHQLC
jgi:hypothetical protein